MMVKWLNWPIAIDGEFNVNAQRVELRCLYGEIANFITAQRQFVKEIVVKNVLMNGIEAVVGTATQVNPGQFWKA